MAACSAMGGFLGQHKHGAEFFRQRRQCHCLDGRVRPESWHTDVCDQPQGVGLDDIRQEPTHL